MNVLLITVDQMRFDHLGLKGVGGIRTPHLDRLGTEGVLFDRAYTPSPVCTSARLSLLTGNYPSIHGGYSIGVTADPFPTPTLPERLGQAGYATALIGKSHFVSRKDEVRHFAGTEHPPSDYFREHTGPYLGFDYVQLASHHTTNGIPACHYGEWLDRQNVDYRPWFPDLEEGHDHSAAGAWAIPVEYHDSTWITQQTRDWITTQAAAAKPWFAWASYNDPHEPFVCPEPWFSRVQMDDVTVPEDYRPGEFDDKPPFYRSVYESTKPQGGFPKAFENEPGNHVPCAYNRCDLRGKERDALQATLGMVSMIDHEVGQLLATLEASGQADDTLVIFTSDHGELHGHHGLWHKGLFTYEDAQRVPLLVRLPGKHPQQGSLDSVVNLVDLPATILAAAGLPLPQGMQGASLLPLISTANPMPRTETVVELQATKRIYQQTFITTTHKLVVYRDQDYGELYDLDTDPDQYKNLWESPDHQTLKHHLMHRFLQHTMRREGHAHDRVAFA